MLNLTRFVVLLVCFSSVPATAQTTDRFALPQRSDLEKRMTRLKPTALHIAGTVALLSDLRHDQNDKVNAPEKSPASSQSLSAWWEKIPADDAQRAQAFAYAAWHLLPQARMNRQAFNRYVNAMASSHAQHPWLAIYRLYQAMLDNNRDALLKAATVQHSPQSFPSVFADESRMEVLKAVGIDKVTAGMHVLQHRRFGSLYALVDLDRYLAREATYLRSANQDNDADKLFAARDVLRTAYLESSRHVVERLFALNLLGRSQQRRELLRRYDLYTRQMKGIR